jgi:hypothetical protein
VFSEVGVEVGCAGDGAGGEEFGYAVALFGRLVDEGGTKGGKGREIYGGLGESGASEEGFCYCYCAEFSGCEQWGQFLDGTFCDFDLFLGQYLLRERNRVQWQIRDLRDRGLDQGDC